MLGIYSQAKNEPFVVVNTPDLFGGKDMKVNNKKRLWLVLSLGRQKFGIYFLSMEIDAEEQQMTRWSAVISLACFLKCTDLSRIYFSRSIEKNSLVTFCQLWKIHYYTSEISKQFALQYLSNTFLPFLSLSWEKQHTRVLFCLGSYNKGLRIYVLHEIWMPLKRWICLL